MELRLLEQEQDIRNAAISLHKTVELGEFCGVRRVSFRGEARDAKVYYHKKYNLWVSYDFVDDIAPHRHWFSYGIWESADMKRFVPTCQTCMPEHGFDNRFGAAFASDAGGTVYLLHSGKIGGGKKGVGKTGFWQYYTTEAVEAILPSSQRSYEMACIGPVNSKNLPELLLAFVENVKEIKRSLEGKQQTQPAPSSAKGQKLSQSEFRAEFGGAKTPYNLSAPIEAQCFHGIIVNQLKEYLNEFCPKNDQLHDLFIENNHSQIETLFEIKADISRQSIYTGVGQLILNSTKSTKNKFLVLHTSCNPAIYGMAGEFGIDVIHFGWEKKGGPVFLGLDKVIQRLKGK